MANVIHKDLVYANATAWQWWLAVSPYDYKDGLVYIDQNKSNGSVYPSKMLWAFGNYSRFIRPGMTRVDLSFSESITGVTASAYINALSKKMVVVIVNTTWDAQKISLTNATNATTRTKIDTYITSEQKNMQKISSSTETLFIEPRSITTLVSDY